MFKKKFSNIPSIIKDAKKGRMFILVDDENRENEGDLVIPGSKCNSKIINFMAKHGRGLICLALTKKQVDKLKLPLMSQINRSRMQTAFTVSIEAKKVYQREYQLLIERRLSELQLIPKLRRKILYHLVTYFHWLPERAVFWKELAILKHRLIFQNYQT